MLEPESVLERWSRLPRSDRSAILARFPAPQRQELVTLIAARHRAEPAPRPVSSNGWAIYSPQMAALLRTIEAKPDDPPHGMTPAATELLLRTATDMRAAQPVHETRPARILREIRRWLKALDL